jgi:hypothetical protein
MKGKLTSWFFVNVNSGRSAVESPYRVAKNRCTSIGSNAPLREGSYRALASTANVFARESFMDEMAALAGIDSLEFRLAHLDAGRLKTVLEVAAKKFDWVRRVKTKDPSIGVGLACGTEKASYTAACVEIAIKDDEISVRRVCQAYECGDHQSGESEIAVVGAMGPRPCVARGNDFRKRAHHQRIVQRLSRTVSRRAGIRHRAQSAVPICSRSARVKRRSSRLPRRSRTPSSRDRQARRKLPIKLADA